MANTGDVGEPETSDDSISLTSTVSSAAAERYEVECILAERNTKGFMEYLTAWKDYPEHRHTWEHRECFFEDDVFDEWTRTQMRITRGLEKPFDVKAWKKRCEAVKKETRLRRQRRRNKKLRLGNRDESTSMPEEHHADTESSGSVSAPKRSDKRIKRRSVHQDPLPSSSISDASSSPISEDSDRPLIARQESEILTAKSKWTQAETIALEEGLRTLKGPRWSELLGLYGRNGTTSQVLKDKTPSDLYDKAKSVRQEFVDSGREPPEYLKPFSKAASSKGSGTATPTIHSETRDPSRTASRGSSRSTSTDSMMAELQEKQRIREAKNRENSRPQQTIPQTGTLNPARGRRKEPNSPEKRSGSGPKALKPSRTPVRRVDVALEPVKESAEAAQSKPHPKKTTLQSTGTAEVKEGSKDGSPRGRQWKDRPSVKEPSKVSASSQTEHQPKSLVTSAEKTTKPPAATAAAKPDSSRKNVPENDKNTREETARTTWTGTARAPTAPTSTSNASRLGAAGSGPARSSSLKLKPKLGQIEPKKPSVTGDVTAAWNAEPKKRNSNNWATTNADPVGGQTPKRNYRLSVQNRIHKSRRDGRVPDPNRLVFVNPRTGKALTSVPAPSATVMPSKTPLQLYQEELATKEAEKNQAQEVEDAMLVSPSEPNPPPLSVDQSREFRFDKHKAPETIESTPNAPASARKSTAGDMTDVPPPPPASPHPAPPPNVPLGPRLETKRMSTLPLQEYTKRSTSSNKLSDEAVVNSQRPYSLDDPSVFTLRSHPSREQKNELFNKPEPDLVIGCIKIGKDDQENLNVKLVGFGFETKKLLLTVKSSPRNVHFVFEKVCLASEYQAYFPTEPSDYLGSGSLVAYHQSASAIENITETLANNLQGGLFFSQYYTMLMYPAGASAWAFLDNNLPNVHPGAVLRFVVRTPLPAVPTGAYPAPARLAQEIPERYAEVMTKIKRYPIQAEEKNINIVFRDMFEIDFHRLVAQNGPQQHNPTNIFFLCFIPQGCEDYEPDSAKRLALHRRTSEEHDLFIRFLQENGAEEIYSMQNIGSQEINSNSAWAYFVKNVKSGTIIFHDAFIRYDLVPRLANHLLRGSVNVWKTSLSPMHPGEKHPHLVRLFPHGGILLLTESLVLYRPRETLRILMWFRRVHIPGKAPGTWKLAVRPRVREWLLDIMDAYADSGKDIFGCSIQIFADIYTEIYWLLQTPDPGDNGLMCCEWDYETPTDEAPIVSAANLRVLQARKEWKGEGAELEPDDYNIRQNDDLLIQWFAEWAIVNLHNFRRYNVILGYTKDHPFTEPAISEYEKAYGHIEVMTYEDAFTRHKVTAQSKLDDMEVERRRKLKEELPAKRAAAKKDRKEERAAAKAALEARMRAFRDVGATEQEAMRAGRQLLREMGGSRKEIEECKVDVDRVFVDKWWEESGDDGEVVEDVMDRNDAAHES